MSHRWVAVVGAERGLPIVIPPNLIWVMPAKGAHMPHRTPFVADAECRTQMHLARRGVVSAEMERVAEREHLAADLVRDEVARGRMIIPANVHHHALDPMAIGLPARVKLDANI